MYIDVHRHHEGIVQNSVQQWMYKLPGFVKHARSHMHEHDCLFFSQIIQKVNNGISHKLHNRQHHSKIRAVV